MLSLRPLQRLPLSHIPRVQVARLAEVPLRKPKLIILGVGWAGFKIAKDIDTRLWEVNIISPRNYFLFTPLLTTTTVGTLEFRCIAEPIRQLRGDINYVQAEATSLDLVNKRVHCKHAYVETSEDGQVTTPEFSMRYDHLVIACGAENNTFGIPGVESYAIFLKDLAGARAIRQRILECFERSSRPDIPPAVRQRLLSFVIVGGGPTSCEFAAELYDFLIKDVPKAFPGVREHMQVTLVEASNSLLGTFSKDLGEYTKRLFAARNIDVITGAAVKSVARQHLTLTDGRHIPFALCVWSTGVKPGKFVQGVSLPKDPKSGRIIVDESLRVKGSQDIWAVGDSAWFEPRPLPPTAQAAYQEGARLALNLNNSGEGFGIRLLPFLTRSVAAGRAPQPFKYRHLGALAYIGDHKVVADLSEKFKGKGFAAWILWNLAYVTRQLSFKNMILVPMNWFKSFVFGRDVTRF